MISETEFLARSRPRMWAVYVLIPCAALLTYLAVAALAPDFAISSGRGAFLNDLPPWMRSTFLFGIAFICLFGALQQFKRKWRPQVEVEAGSEGITSHLFWGKGRLRWTEIKAIERQSNWLFVRGTANGRSKKLVIDTGGIDAPIDHLYALIARYRPDLMVPSQA